MHICCKNSPKRTTIIFLSWLKCYFSQTEVNCLTFPWIYSGFSNFLAPKNVDKFHSETVSKDAFWFLPVPPRKGRTR